ncbi:hypothetical protein ACLMJK_005134 [Lecanora helva]
MKISELQQNADLWYRIHVLLHDLANIGKDHLAAARISSTTSELYISPPYFADLEASTILGTKVRNNASAEGAEDDDETDHEAFPTAAEDSIPIETAIKQRMANFFDKRKASGDARPCGPHDLVPIYAAVFGIPQCDLRNEKFLSRLGRFGLGNFMTRDNETATKDSNVKGKRGKKGR